MRRPARAVAEPVFLALTRGRAMTRRGSTIRGPRAVLAALALACSLLPSCTSLPDTRGYTAATIQVKQAVASSGDVVRQELREAIAARATAADDASVKSLDAAWTTTAKTLDAMVAYAQSIEQIVDAGNRGAESAERVADSVKTLAECFKISAVTGASAELVQLATDTAKLVAGEYA
jgi:hypothetical protein